jgi:hypothetical protein
VLPSCRALYAAKSGDCRRGFPTIHIRCMISNRPRVGPFTGGGSVPGPVACTSGTIGAAGDHPPLSLLRARCISVPWATSTFDMFRLRECHGRRRQLERQARADGTWPVRRRRAWHVRGLCGMSRPRRPQPTTTTLGRPRTRRIRTPRSPTYHDTGKDNARPTPLEYCLRHCSAPAQPPTSWGTPLSLRADPCQQRNRTIPQPTRSASLAPGLSHTLVYDRPSPIPASQTLAQRTCPSRVGLVFRRAARRGAASALDSVRIVPQRRSDQVPSEGKWHELTSGS